MLNIKERIVLFLKVLKDKLTMKFEPLTCWLISLPLILLIIHILIISLTMLLLYLIAVAYINYYYNIQILNTILHIVISFSILSIFLTIISFLKDVYSSYKIILDIKNRKELL